MKRSPGYAVCWRWLPVVPLLFGAACGGPQSLGDAGAKCFRDDDCAPGLICVAPEADPINRVCSSDPTPLVSNVDGPPIAMGGDAAMAGSAGAAIAGGGAAPVAGGGMGGTMPAAGTDTGGSDTGGTATAGTNTGGTAGMNAGGTPAGGTPAGGTPAGGTAGTNAGTDPGGTSGTAGTTSDGGAP